MSQRLIEIAIEPRSREDQAKLEAAIARLAGEHPMVEFAVDAESGQTLLKVDAEERFIEVIERLGREFGVEALFGQPQVAYRETLGVPAEVEYTHKKTFGPMGQFARVKILFEPLPRGSGEIFEIGGNAIPKEYIPGVEKGLKSVAESGIIAGFPVVDFKATLIDGAYHDVDSSVNAFEIASRAAFREAAKSARPMLLEPIMTVEVVAPNDYAAPILRDLRTRRTKETTTRREGMDAVVVANTPLANLFNYELTLAEITEGRGRFTTTFARYEPVPKPPPPDDDLFPPAVGKRA